MPRNLSRRQWTAAAVTGLAAAVPAAAPAQSPAPPPPDSPAELLTQARQGVERTRETLSKYKIPMPLEPATRFEA